MWTLEAGFVFLCFICGGGFLLYLIGVAISCWAAARSDRRRAAKRAANHRVGGAISFPRAPQP